MKNQQSKIGDQKSEISDQKSGISVSTNALGKRFNREWIFRNFTYEFHPGHTYAVVGPNGSGKSTLLQILWGQSVQSAGIIRYTSGQKEIPMTDIFSHVSVATPYMDLIDEFTLSEHLDFHFQLKKPRQGFSKEIVLEKMYLQSSRNKAVGNFSSGMRQRLKLGLAFYTQADIVFLDEPGTNLDKQAFTWYLNELHQLPATTLVVIASNNPEEYPSAREVIRMSDFK